MSKSCLLYFSAIIFGVLTQLSCSKAVENSGPRIEQREPVVTTISSGFSGPTGLAIDASGNLIIAGGYQNKVVKIDTSGNLSTIAGSGSIGVNDGIGTAASFYYPSGAAVGPTGNIFISDHLNNQVRKISVTGAVTTFAGSRSSYPTGISFDTPFGIATDLNGYVYVVDEYRHRIVKLAPDGNPTVLAGTGISGFAEGNGSVAQFRLPSGIAVDKLGNVFVADRSNNRIRKISLSGIVSTYAGNGTVGSVDGMSINASFNAPTHLAIDDSSNLYVTDWENQKIRKIAYNGLVTTIAGSGVKGHQDGPASQATFADPCGIVVDKKGNIYVSEFTNNTIRKITF